MVTVPANKLIVIIADRMPAGIEGVAWAKWLGEEQLRVAELKALLVPFEGDWTMEPAKKAAPPEKPDGAEPKQPRLI